MSPIASPLITYAQKIVTVGNDDGFYVELLSRFRPGCGDPQMNISDFFKSISVEERLVIFERQNRTADEIFKSTGIKCSINVDNELLETEEIRDRTLYLIQTSTAPSIYEFTEVYPMPPPELMNPIFNLLRDLGKRSALDDFGTGFNGMSLFVDFDFDIVKVDRSLINDITTRPKKLSVLALIREMIQTLGKACVVEGVETANQLAVLKDASFQTFQGYFFHKPEPVGNFCRMLELVEEA
jgi:EAL domain-containing protein (putative c-di-GMP-specific phosphodiesterase class I)